MKKLLALILALLTLSLLAACKSTEETPAADTPADLHTLTDSVKGFFADGTEFVFSADEESANDTLIFNYFVEDEEVLAAVSDYVLSVTDGMTADTFAVVRFKDGTPKETVNKLEEIFRTVYMTSLKDSLSMYAPDEAAAVGNGVITVSDNSCTLVISSAHLNEIMEIVY